MNKVPHLAVVVASLLLTLGHPAHGGPPNPTASDNYGNTAGGTDALLNANPAFGYGTRNTAFGFHALTSNHLGYGNTASGYEALYRNTRGYGNTASGFKALYSNNSTNSTRANYNTASGYEALYRNTSGGGNTASGVDALRNKTTGNYNTAVGYGAGSNLTTGNNNIYLANAGPPPDAHGSAIESNTMRLGSAQTRAFVAGVYGTAVVGVPVYVTSAGQLGYQSSSARFKQDIAPLGPRSEPLYQLRPVSFHYKQEPKGPLQYGLIAEEVATVYPNLVMRDADGKIAGVRYDALIPLLLNELQRQHRQSNTQNQQLNAQTQQLNAQAQQITAVLQQLVELRAQNESLRAAVGRLQRAEAQQRTAQIEVAIPARPAAFDAPDFR